MNAEAEFTFKGFRAMFLAAGFPKKRLEILKNGFTSNGGIEVDKKTLASETSRKIIIVVSETASSDGVRKHLESQGIEDLDEFGAVVLKASFVAECLEKKTIVDESVHRVVISPRKKKRAADAEEISQSQAKRTRFSLDPEKFACAHASSSQSTNLNEVVTSELEKLLAAYKANKDTWRIMSYERVIRLIKSLPYEITSWEQARNLRGVGDSLADKIWEIVESGKLRKAEEMGSSDRVKTMEIFTGVWGVGPTIADHWYARGWRSLDDVRAAPPGSLTRQQEIGLRHYEDFNSRIPREEAAEIEAFVHKAAKELLGEDVIAQACGSYRRGKPTCGDVDVLVTKEGLESHENVFEPLLESLRKSGFLTADLSVQDATGSQRKYLGVCRLPGESRKFRRLDVIVVPWKEYAPALMYFTGSAHFNRSMRLLASKMGMSLSEHSLQKGVSRVGREKITRGICLDTPSEESIFEHLGLKYRPPEDRDH